MDFGPKPLNLEAETFLYISEEAIKLIKEDIHTDCPKCKGKRKLYNKYDKNYETCDECNGVGQKYFKFKYNNKEHLIRSFYNNKPLLNSFPLNSEVIYKNYNGSFLVHIGADGNIYPFKSLNDFNVRNYRAKNT